MRPLAPLFSALPVAVVLLTAPIDAQVYPRARTGSNYMHNFYFPPAGSSTPWWPSWSPDGTKISFVTDRDGNDEVYVMNADGSSPANLTNNPSSDFSSTWSADGSRIAFESQRTGDWDLYTVPAGGGAPIQITVNNADDEFPRWRP